MFNSVEYIRTLCQHRKIPVSLLEKDCGFSNGYLNPKKLKRIPYDRALIIANYLNIPVDFILHGEEKMPTPVSESGHPVNIVKIAGRDGSYVEKRLTDDQVKALRAIVDQFPDASDDL